MRQLGALVAVLCVSLSGGAARAEPGGQVLGDGLGSPALSASGRALPPQRDAERSTVAPLWTFHAGAPLRAGAGLGEGGIAVGSADGYVHALRADGAYRWSYTVKGAVVATPLVDARGAVYVLTTARKLYALTPSGTLAWGVTLAGVALDPPRWSKDRELLVTTREGVAYAITTSGGMRAAVALREPLTTAPLPLPSGRWLVGGARGNVFALEGFRASREQRLPSPVLALVARGDSYVGLSAEGLFGPGLSVDVGAQRLGCGPERVLVTAEDGRVGWLEGKSVQWLAALAEPLSAAPACTPDGRALVPLASGALVVMARDGRLRRYSIGPGALFTPVVDAARGQVIVSAADGRSLALPLGAL